LIVSLVADANTCTRSTPPPLIVVDVALPPDTTVSDPPLLIVVRNALPIVKAGMECLTRLANRRR